MVIRRQEAREKLARSRERSLQTAVRCEETREDYPHLQEGMKVNTPVGLATITSIVQCPILKKPRCSVQTADKQPDGSHFRAFHLSEVTLLQFVSLSQQVLYTFGYQQGHAEKTFCELIALQTPIVDIRYNPTSKNWKYTQAVLSKRDGIIYHHLRELGNEHYHKARSGEPLEATMKIHNLDVGLEKLQTLLAEYGRVAMMCMCASVKHCHRHNVASEAEQQLKIKVVHL